MDYSAFPLLSFPLKLKINILGESSDTSGQLLDGWTLVFMSCEGDGYRGSYPWDRSLR